jgi:hypothetical protein
MSFEFSYLGKFEVRFETNLGFDSRGLVSSFDEKNRGKKSHDTVPLRTQQNSILQPSQQEIKTII